MKKNISKSTLAKEYLILLSTIIVIVLSYFTLKVNLNQKIDKISEQITYNKTLLTSKKETERLFFFNAFNDNFPNNYTYSEFWQRLESLAEKDSIETKWKSWDSSVISFNKKMGYITPEQFRKFIISNTLSPQEVVYKERMDSKIGLLEAEKKFEGSKENFNDKFIIISIILLFVIYPFRFLLKGLVWSLKNLSSKN